MRGLIAGFIWVCLFALAMYVGPYLMFICSIIDIIETVRADVLDTSIVVWGIGKILISGFVTSLIIWLGTFISAIILDV